MLVGMSHFVHCRLFGGKITTIGKFIIDASKSVLYVGVMSFIQSVVYQKFHSNGKVMQWCNNFWSIYSATMLKFHETETSSYTP